MPIPIFIGLGSGIAGRLAVRIGPRWPLSLGSAFVGLGLLLYFLVGDGDISYWTAIFPGTLVVAIGMVSCVAPLTTTVMSSVESKDTGVASGFNSAVARMGGLIATALLSFVMSQDTSHALFMTGFHRALIGGGVLCGVASLCGVLLIAPHLSKKKTNP